MQIRPVHLLWSSALLAIIDQLIKIFLVPYFGLPVWYNEGVSFSIQVGGPWQLGVIVAIFVAVAVWLWRLDWHERSRFSFIAAMLVTGGAIGNLVDRLRLEGKVLDYIAFAWFPVFNFADICISMGVVALILHVYLHGQRPR